MSARQLMLLAVFRNKPLCQAPPPWHHNAIIQWCHIQNITSFWDLKLDILNNIKIKGKYWLNFVVSKSNKTVLLQDTVHHTTLEESTAGTDLWSAEQLLTPLRRSGGPYHIITYFFIVSVNYQENVAKSMRLNNQQSKLCVHNSLFTAVHVHRLITAATVGQRHQGKHLPTYSSGDPCDHQSNFCH